MVEAKYDVRLRCTEAVGSYGVKCVGGTARAVLTLTLDRQTLLTGNGQTGVRVQLVELRKPDGSDALSAVDESTRIQTLDTLTVVGHRLAVHLDLAGVSVDGACYLDNDGSALVHGEAQITVSKFVWKFFLRSAEAEFSGTLTNPDILGA